MREKLFREQSVQVKQAQDEAANPQTRYITLSIPLLLTSPPLLRVLLLRVLLPTPTLSRRVLTLPRCPHRHRRWVRSRRSRLPRSTLVQRRPRVPRLRYGLMRGERTRSGPASARQFAKRGRKGRESAPRIELRHRSPAPTVHWRSPTHCRLSVGIWSPTAVGVGRAAGDAGVAGSGGGEASTGSSETVLVRCFEGVALRESRLAQAARSEKG